VAEVLRIILLPCIDATVGILLQEQFALLEANKEPSLKGSFCNSSTETQQ
jgi:hypothetical protein